MRCRFGRPGARHEPPLFVVLSRGQMTTAPRHRPDPGISNHGCYSMKTIESSLKSLRCFCFLPVNESVFVIKSVHEKDGLRVWTFLFRRPLQGKTTPRTAETLTPSTQELPNYNIVISVFGNTNCESLRRIFSQKRIEGFLQMSFYCTFRSFHPLSLLSVLSAYRSQKSN